jgi:NADPH:quinone reductase-like Zn-dependent oxidoreductase
MKAVVWTKHGATNELNLREVEKPTPGDDEVLIRVYASTVIAGDVVLRRIPSLMYLPLSLFGIRRKPIPGHEFAGVVEAVGKAVTRFKPGDRVFGTTTGLSVGANAEYVCLPETWERGVLALKPSNMTYDEAAAAPVGSMTAYHFLSSAHIHLGQNVLIYGASGSIGTFAVQLARYYGATVTGVCSGANAELVKSLGADHIIDYTQDDFTRSGAAYDVIFDAVGKLSPSQGRQALRDGGCYLSVKTGTREKTEHLVFLKDLIEAGKLKSVIDRRYPLEQTAEAYRYVATGRKRGNIVITVAQGSES